MTTLDFVSTSADGIRQAHEPLISVGAITASLGSNPALTLPMIAGEVPDVHWIWDYLAEAAGYFGIAIPSPAELELTCEQFSTSAAARRHWLLAVTIVLIEVDDRTQFVVTGDPVDLVDPVPVRIAVGDSRLAQPGPSDPLWRRMAARTTSRGEIDHIQRGLNDDGFTDQVARRGEPLIGRPMLGALVLDRGDGLIGIDRPGEAGVLGLMERCGLIRAGMVSEGAEFVDAGHVSSAWWISPRFEVHAVDAIGTVQYPCEANQSKPPPRFLERLP